MVSHLQLVLLIHVVKVYSQTCYDECLKESAGDITTVNIMIFDASESVTWRGSQQWYDRKTDEFNALYPAIAVTAEHVKPDDMVREAEEDLELGTNRYHAYVIPMMNADGGTSRLADRLMDLSTFTVDHVNEMLWPTIGRFYRVHASLYDGKVLTLPLVGDSFSLYYRRDIFDMHGMTVPRTLEEYMLASRALNGTDLNGDEEPDYGSCLSHVGVFSELYFLTWISQTLQYQGTSQGSTWDPNTLNPLLENPVVQEAIKLWKQVAGPPEMTEGTTMTEMLELWMSGRCAMTITASPSYTVLRSTPLKIGTAVMPGSEKVWEREGKKTAMCNQSLCRHATEYQDGLVVNHAPAGQSVIDGAINGQIGKAQQLAAYTFLTWLMNDANMLEAVVNPPSWPNLFLGTFVKPSLLTPNVWTPYGWVDPAISLYCATQTKNVEHPNALMGSRLPNSVEYYAAVKKITGDLWRGQGEFEGLDEEAAAIAASVSITTKWQEVTDLGDRNALIVTYQKILNIYVVAEQPQRTARRGDHFPPWAVHSLVVMLGGSLFLAFFVFACWLTVTVLQRQRLRAKQQAAWDEIVDDAEAYATSLCAPMALIRAADFLDFGHLVEFEVIREEGKLRFLDTLEKVYDFQKNFITVFLSHQWLSWNTPDPDGVHFKTMCAAVSRAAQIANVSLDNIFLWVDVCSIPQEHLSTRVLFLAAVPLYVSLCDFFIVIAPPTAHDGIEVDMSTHFRQGWCRAELLARVVGSGVQRLHVCESCNGSLQQVTYEMVHGIDLNVFLGDFRCCSLGHMGCRRCDREKLRTPILGIYAQYCRTFMSDHRVAAGPGMTHLFPIEQIELDKERMFPRFFEFVTAPGDPPSSVEVRELFGPLPEMLEQRIRKRGAAQEKFNNSSVVETPGVEGVHEEEKTLRSFSAPGGLLQGLAQDEGGESTGNEGTSADLHHEVSDDGMVSDSHVFIGNDTWESEAGIFLDDIDISIHMTPEESVHWTCACLC